MSKYDERKQYLNLLPSEVRLLLPPLYATDGKPREQVIAQAKIFDPCGRFTLYVCEFDGEDTLFGWVVSPLGDDCNEWGYSSLAELQGLRNRLGLPLERDLGWKPGPIPELQGGRP